ncbi:FAD-dependent oxidoreductase [Mycoplasma cottewii]|uniref:FAD-dependent oxidoreductase n=1 Tax=Mycoplasma cottewii TaxID=51364 RepID=A0ABY5TZK3_9MOLU|nr:FAD-dependent oxidoreductase [Mycoplasma cottewii]UWD34658.1 FAD-dependent oxidoreductase [Mycoplasma cottewii]
MRVVIIGGAASGMTVASRIKKLSNQTEVIVIQKEDYVSLGACGLPYFVGNKDLQPNNLLARSVEQFSEQNIVIHTKSVVEKIDDQNKKIWYRKDDNLIELSYDKLVISTGAKPIVPPVKGIELDNIFTLTRLEDGIKLKEKLQNDSIKKVAVIGSGFIGLECLEMLAEFNKEITLIEKESQLNKRIFDKEITDLLEENLIKNNINIIKNNGLAYFEKSDSNNINIVLENNSKLEVDLVILAIGFRPATQFLNDSNIEMLKNGAIVVDNKGRTNLADIWSCGDCATSIHRITKQNTYTPLATVARKFAKVVADDILTIDNQYQGTLQTAIVKSFDSELASTGINESTAKELNYEYKTVFIKDYDHPSYYANPNPTPLALKLILNTKTNTLIGAQMYGSNLSVMRINFLISLIWNEIKIDNSLTQIDLPYAPPFSRVVDIIHIALEKLLK